jgi:hypothetical protein
LAALTERRNTSASYYTTNIPQNGRRNKRNMSLTRKMCVTTLFQKQKTALVFSMGCRQKTSGERKHALRGEPNNMQEMRLIRRCLVLAALMLTALPVSLLAQDGKNIRTVLFVRLKPERTGDWRAAVKDYAALMKKSGSEEYFTVWASQSGPDEYAVVWNSARWKNRTRRPKT